MNDARHALPGAPRPVAREGTPTALFLDFDGTLVDIAPTPDAVIVPPGLASLLARLEAALGGALAIVSGRPIADIDRMLAPIALVVAGGHGAEIRTGGDGVVHAVTPAFDRDLEARVVDWATSVPGLLVERKASSLAVHFRRNPEARDLVAATLSHFLVDAPELRLLPGRGVLEILPRTVSKGAAVDFLLARPPFRDRRPLVIGDDVTDVSAFDAVLRFGGRAARVAGETWTVQEADFRDPGAVRAHLARLLEEIER